MCASGDAHVYLTGISPLTLSEAGTGFNIAQRPQNYVEFASMFGFEHKDVKSGIELAGVTNSDAATELLDWYKERHDGYLFHPDSDAHMYNPNQIIYELQFLSRQVKTHSNNFAKVVESVKDKSRSRDGNSYPAEHVLDTVAMIPTVSTILPQLLQTNSCISFKGPLLEQVNSLAAAIIIGFCVNFLFLSFN